MAEVHELEVEEVSEIGEIEAEAQKQEQQQEEVRPDPQEDVPDEFRGKSVAELARIAQHARREMGRQANELGEIRKLADELIKTQLKPKVEVEQPKEVDFFENPQEAINRAVASNPEVLAAKQYAMQAQQAMAKQKLAELHPDYMNVMQDQEFAQWVTSSQIRKNLLQQADQQYDLSAAHELLSTYKELKAVKMQHQQREVTTTEQKDRDKVLRSASVDTGGSGESTRKVYRRADLIRLKMNDPSRYEAMNDEIMAAYAEGRVR